MHYILFLLIALSCSSEKKLRGKNKIIPDTDDRISHDWNRDGFPETIIISPASESEEYRELIIFRGVPEGVPREILLKNKNLIPRRAKPGASLRLHKDFSFSLIVDSSSGRTGEVVTWRNSWRKGRFVLTGMVRDRTDKLDPLDHQNCDVDLRSGRGSKNGKLIKFEPVLIDLLELNERFMPSICEF